MLLEKSKNFEFKSTTLALLQMMCPILSTRIVGQLEGAGQRPRDECLGAVSQNSPIYRCFDKSSPSHDLVREPRASTNRLSKIMSRVIYAALLILFVCQWSM